MRAVDILRPSFSGKLRMDLHEIYWEFFGRFDNNKETVCLTNGLAMQTTSWYGVIPFIYADFNVLLFDLPGQGNSSCEDEPLLIPHLSYYLYCIMNRLEIDKVHLIGISYGAFIAFDFARLYEERLFSLTVSGGYLHAPHNITYRLESKRNLLDSNKFDEFVDILYDELFGQDFKTKQQEAYARLKKIFYDRYRNRLYMLARLFDAQKEYVDNLEANRDDYRKIGIPTYIVVGAADIVFPIEHQKKITELIPYSRLDVIDGAGHLVYLQMPEEFFSRVKRFFQAKSIHF